MVDGVTILVGNRGLLRPLDRSAGNCAAGGDTSAEVFMARERCLLGAIVVANTVRPEAKRAIKAFNRMGIRSILLTGDTKPVAEIVARDFGIGEAEADLLPEMKLARIKGLVTAGRVVAMAGDGINDASSLAQAHVGIAMGTGTDVAMESAVKGDLRDIVKARRLSHATMRNIWQNLFFAFVYNTLGIPIAAGILYPIFGVLLSPIIASATMSLSSVSDRQRTKVAESEPLKKDLDISRVLAPDASAKPQVDD